MYENYLFTRLLRIFIPTDLIVASVLLVKIHVFLPFPKPLAVQITDP